MNRSLIKYLNYGVLLILLSATSSRGQFFPGDRYGQPVNLGSGGGDLFGDGEDFDKGGLTPEEQASKRINPLPFLVNPGIRRGVQNLQHGEARYQRQPSRLSNQLLKPLLDIFTNPSRK